MASIVLIVSFVTQSKAKSELYEVVSVKGT